MSGGPSTQANLITQFKAVVDVLESFRVHADDVQAADSGKLQAIEDAVSGEFTPDELTAFAANFRDGMSGLMSPGVAQDGLEPIAREWGRVIDLDAIDTFGGGYTSLDDILDAIYEYLVLNSDTVESRGISFDGNPEYGKSGSDKGTNTGDGTLRRLTVDENNYELEATTVQRIHFRCRRDANTGGEGEAEVFEVLGSSPGRKDFLRAAGTGTGELGSLGSLHAGAGAGGSLLSNGSFDDFDSTSLVFSSWVKTIGAACTLGQDTTAAFTYRSYPAAPSTIGSAKLECRSSQTMLLTQELSTLNTQSLNPNRPYFLRVMIKGDGSQAGGNINMRLGSRTATLSIASVTTAWQELIIPLDQNCWFANFNQDEDTNKLIEIEWAGGTAGTVYFDDMIFQELVRMDGLYYVLTQNKATPIRWLQDDLITLEDTFDTSYGSGKLQTWWVRAFNRYLPHQGSPSITDP